MESLATIIRFVTLNCRTLSSELQQAALSRCAFVRLRDRRGRKLWIVSAHAPTETTEDNSKNAFYDELNALTYKITSEKVVIVGIDANAKMGLEQLSDVLEKWYYPAERRLDNDANHRRHQPKWQGLTLLTPEEQRKRKMRRLKHQLDHDLTRNIPQSDLAEAPSAPEPKHFHRPTHAVSGKPPTESEVLVCIRKMKNGKSGGDNGISAEMLKDLPPSEIREMTNIIR
ncbi:hypothetical protein RB195_001724 [Necator americanus]|uniref:Uncharacterized protein n=1 Tax=Necator americanus TaxID=51031 RepID=A0ABR1DFM6_NECAM